MNLYKSLLFLHGHITDTELAVDLAQRPSAPSISQWSENMNYFKSLLYLGGLGSITSRVGEEEEAYGPTYGNRIASQQKFGKPSFVPAQPKPAKFAPQEPLGCH